MREIIGYEGLYAITSCGKVWSYRRKKFLAPRVSRGYCQVSLCKDGQVKNYYIHKLVAEAYLPNPLGMTQVNHKDEDKTHNWLNNLEWCDSQYNANYGTRNERMGLAHKKSIYCVELDEIFDSATDASRELGISLSHISDCCRGTRKTCGGYHWQFADN